ncbi:hypothetical protein JW865_06860, partial [Candidatus Bathyarchaeota archaeon]|nr:hypothetical protein [Candidatus Bathyarchaeota archaeon]
IFITALYRELRSSIGYYDARRIIRAIKDNSDDIQSIDEFGYILEKLGYDQRITKLFMEAYNKTASLNK